MPDIKIKIRIILWTALGLLLVWLVYMTVVPGGKITYKQDFTASSYFIRALTPDDRVERTDSHTVKLTGDPVYFALYTPRRFDKAKLTIEYKNDSTKPIIETGALVDKTVWRYSLKPLDNSLLDRLAGDWNAVREGETLLLQRQPDYDSIGDFLANPPGRGRIAVYNYDLRLPYLLSGYASSSAMRDIGIALRGDYQFYTYVKDEPLRFDFTFHDLNLNRDPDPVEIILYYNGEPIDSRKVEDAGAPENGQSGGNEKASFDLPGLPEGVYKIAVRAGSDIVTDRIDTAQSKLSLIGKVPLYASGEENFVFYTDSRQIQAVTSRPESLQTLRVGSSTIDMAETYRQYTAQTDAKPGQPAPIELEKDGITLTGDGVFTLRPEELLNPAIRKVDATFDPDKEGIDYVIAGYYPPASADGWQTAAADIDLSSAYRENGAYSFIISIPGLRADDEIDDFVEIKSIKADLEGKSLFEKIKEIL